MKIEIDPVDTTGPGVVTTSSDGLSRMHTPDSIHATVTDSPWVVTFTVTFGKSLVPEMSKLHIDQRPGGPLIGADVMRLLRLGRARDEAVKLATTRSVKVGGRWRVDLTPPRDTGAVLKRESHRVTEDRLVLAAAAYRKAKKEGARNHLERVAIALDAGRATADRYLRRARKAGLLGPDE